MGGSLLDRLLRSARVGGRRALPDPDPITGERRSLERRGEARYELPDGLSSEHRVAVALGDNGALYRVCNLSVSGLRFDVGDGACSLAVGDNVAVRILLGEVRLPASLEVKNIEGTLYGCRLVETDAIWAEEVAKVIDPIAVGGRLREIDPRFVKQDAPGLDARWFQAGPLCDLFLWQTGAGEVRHAQLFFSWQLVDWTPEHGLRSGQVETQSSADTRHARSELFTLTSPPHSETLLTAQRLLAAAAVPAPVRALFGL